MSVAQARGPRSDEKDSLAQAGPSCLGEGSKMKTTGFYVFSLERDDSSLKTEAHRLSESSSRNQGELLLFLPRRDMLAWAKIPVLAIVHACNNRTFKTKQHFNVFQATTIAHKHYKHETKLKTGRH